MHIDVNTKFEVGQEVYIIGENIRQVRNESKCPICEGVGTIVYKGHELRCSNCNNGVVLAGIDHVSMFSIFNRGNITGIRFQYANDNSATTKYKIYGRFIPECRIFATQEEAQARCDELNKGGTDE